MITVKNQKRITIDKPSMKDCKHFAYYDRDAMARACEVLNGSEFKLWVYLLAQAPNIKWTVSASAIQKEFGIPEATYHRAMNGLREKGYLDDKAIHMTINLIDSQNESDQIKMIVNDSQNDDRNKINNKISNNDNNFLNINVEKVDDQPKEEKFVF